MLDLLPKLGTPTSQPGFRNFVMKVDMGLHPEQSKLILVEGLVAGLQVWDLRLEVAPTLKVIVGRTYYHYTNTQRRLGVTFPPK